MAVGDIPQGNYNREVRRERDEIRANDLYDSLEGFVNAANETGNSAGSAWAEMDRSPEARQQIIAEHDVDDKLLLQLLAQRRGFRGVLNRFSRTTVGRFLASSALGMGIKTVVGHVVGETTKAVSGGIAGGVGGAVFGYLRGKDQTESAATWMTELGILELDRAEIEGMRDEELYMALGMMRNAIEGGRVRGNPEQKLEMVAKFRLIKNRLSARVAEPRENEQQLNPVLKKIKDKLASATDETRLISDMAGAEYKEFYESIVGIKKNRTLMSAVKGGIIGATVGALAGKLVEGAQGWLTSDAGQAFLENHPGFHAVHDWVQNVGHNISEKIGSIGHHASVEDKMHEQMETLRNGQLAPEIAQHDADLDSYTSYADTGTLPSDHLVQSGAVSHLAGIDAVNPDNVYGLQGNDLSVFNNMLHAHTDPRIILDFADVHNLDLTAHTQGGESLLNLLQNNADTFARMPADVQNFMLSHPSVAGEFINSMNADPGVFLAHISDKINGAMAMAGINSPTDQWAIGLGAAGLAFMGANAWQGNRFRKELGSFDAKSESNRDAMTAFELQRNAENLADSKSKLQGHIIRFNIANVPGYTLPVRRPNEFVIDRIDPRTGEVYFVYTDRDLEIRRQGRRRPHPELNISQLLTGENLINRDIVDVASTAEQEAVDRQDDERDANIVAARERLIGATIRFTDLMDTNIAATHGRVFRINDIQPDGSIIFDARNHRAVPALDLDTILTPDGNINLTYINITEEASAPRAAGEPEPEPEPEAELNLRPFEGMLGLAPAPATIGRDTRGNMVARFVPPITIAAWPARLRGQVRIDGDAIEGLPVPYAANIILNTVRADGNEPVFEPVLRRVVVPGQNYELQVRHENGAKPNLVSSLRALAGTPQRLVLFSPAIGGYIQYRGFNLATANCFSFASIDPATGTWSGALAEMDAAAVNGLPEVYQFGRI